MNKIICFFIGHKRGKTKVEKRHGHYHWFIWCSRCGYDVTYNSPRARLVSKEMAYGFDGN